MPRNRFPFRFPTRHAPASPAVRASSWEERTLRFLERPVSSAPLASFRVLFGLVMAAATLRFAARGWIAANYLEPAWRFPFEGFGWLPVAPAPLLYALFALQGLAALSLALGWRSRASAAVFGAVFTYVELLDKTYYLNHYYFVSLVALLLAVLPSGARFSLDARRRGARDTIPFWQAALVPFQVGLVYFFAGVAKLDPDWLWRAEPLATWLPAQAHRPLLGPWLAHPAAPWLLSWGGLLYDLSVPFALAWRRTRPWALLAAFGFHAVTGWLWPIGVFPVLMSAAVLVFVDARRHEAAQGWLAGRWPSGVGLRPKAPGPAAPARRWPLALAAAWVLLHLALPFRYLAHDGDLPWTEAGYRFSWRVLLIEKAGHAEFRVRDADGRTALVLPSDRLSPLQEKMLATQPDLLRQFARGLAAEYAAAGFRSPAVYADVWVRLNGRASTRFVRPDVDLAALPRGTPRTAWLMPSPRERDPARPPFLSAALP